MAFPFDCFLCPVDKDAATLGPFVDPENKMPCSPCSWTLQTTLAMTLEPLDLATVEQVGSLLRILFKRSHSQAYVRDRFNIASSVLVELIKANFLRLVFTAGWPETTPILELADHGVALVTLGKADGFWPSIMETKPRNAVV